MAGFQAQPELGGGGIRRRRRNINGINMTPLIDVMLVLLIVFMVTAPMITIGVRVNLPKADAPLINSKHDPLVINLAADGKIYIQDLATDFADLPERIQAILKTNPELRVFVRADHKLDYGLVMQVVSVINKAGVAKIAFITQTEEPKL